MTDENGPIYLGVLENLGRAIEANTAAIEAAGNKIANMLGTASLQSPERKEYPIAPPTPLEPGAPITFSFGKHKGRPLRDIPIDYLTWFLDQPWAQEKWPDDVRAVEAMRSLDREACNPERKYTDGLYELDDNKQLTAKDIPI